MSKTLPILEKSKSIAFFVNANEFDGASRAAYELCRELTKYVDVTIFLPIVPRYKYLNLLLWKNLGTPKAMLKRTIYIARSIIKELVFCRFSWVFDRENTLETVRFLKPPKKNRLDSFDWIIINSWYHVLDFQSYWEMRKSAFIIFHHHYEDYGSIELNSLRNHIVENTHSITDSVSSMEYIMTKLKERPDVLFLGINPNIFRPAANIESRRFSVGLYRGFEERKGFSYGFEALNAVAMDREMECCILQGSSRVGVRKNNNYMIFAGLSDEELAGVYSNIDIFVFPSLFEGFGLPPLEAMACGCAVVSTGVGAVGEYASHMEDAYIVKAGSVEEIERAIVFLLDNPAEKMRIQSNAVTKALNFTWANSVENLLTILQARG